MKSISFSDPHRRKHFEHFQAMEMPHFSLVAHIPFAKMKQFLKDHQWHFTSAIVYLISKSANSIPQLRWRIHGNDIVEHEVVHPSFSVQTKGSDVFSFCYVKYESDFPAFVERSKQAIMDMQENPSFEDEAHRDDYLFLSGIPWVHFTGLTHAMPIAGVDSVPRITWGKLGPESEGMKLPLGLQAHHALVDGRHAGEFFQRFELLCAHPDEAFGG